MVLCIPSKYTNKSKVTTGNVQISAKDIEYCRQFAKMGLGEKWTAAIKRRIVEKCREGKEEGWDEGDDAKPALVMDLEPQTICEDADNHSKNGKNKVYR